jgi:NADH:ubiquinone oxidoreductase subunit 6 (subunit J)
VIGGAAIIYLVGRLAMLLIHVKLPNEQVALNAPAPVQLPPLRPGLPGELADWGSTKAVGFDLFGPGLFPFEAISILLLVAVVGAIAIARHLQEDPHAAGPQGGPGGYSP